MEFIDYYKILGVSKDASREEIQRAYRKLARKFHPDVNKDKDAEAQFQKINEANEVLKDPEKRKLYDTYGQNWEGGFQQNPAGNQGFRQGAGAENFSRSFRFSSQGSPYEASDFSDFFNSIFGGGFADQHTSAGGFDRAGRSHEADITVSLSDVLKGATRAISLQSYEADNSGQVRPVTKTLQVKIPKGVTDGSVIRLAGQGEKAPGGGVSGDLLLRVNIARDARFQVDGHDLVTVVAVTPWEAALGAKVPVETVDGTVTLRIPKGSQNGRRLHLRGKGIPRQRGTPGDIIVQLEIRVPETLTSDEETLLKEIAQKSTYDPRAKRKQRAGSHGRA